jgi:geranylgeranyl pyrophosphate synthase
MQHLNTYLDKIRTEIVEARMRAFKSPSMIPHAEIFQEIMDYNFQSLGKMLRPALCVLICDALGGAHDEGIHLGSSIELVHAGSLVHDDFIDEDEFRHGQLTVWKKFGIKASVLFGDILYVNAAVSVRTLPEEHMADAFKELMDVFGLASSGAMRETYRSQFNMNDYIDIIKLKTASLYRGSARLGSIASNATEDTKNLIGQFGEQVGIAFQIADDLVDVQKSYNEQIPIGDMKEGKVTLPIIYIHEKYPELHRECDRYAKGIKDVREIPGIFEKLPEALSYTRDHIGYVLEQANKYSTMIPFNNGYRDLVDEYGLYAIGSMLKEV